MMKILIGYDGSAAADEALADLALAGFPAKAQALVLSVAVPWSDFSAGGDGAFFEWTPIAATNLRAIDKHAMENAEVLAKRARNYLESRHPEWKIKAEAVTDFPAQGILSKAEAWKPDVIVLGSHGRTALGKLLLGSVSNNVLHHAHTSVRINRSRIRSSQRALRLVVGIDGSSDSNQAIVQIASRQWPEGTQVRLVAVFDNAVVFEKVLSAKRAKGIAQFQTSKAVWIQKKLAAAESRLTRKGLQIITEIHEGDPRHILLKRAADLRADCIFLGCRGLNALKRFMLGSVSSSVASHASCTVEVVRKT